MFHDLIWSSLQVKNSSFTSLGMPAAGENESQSFWGSDLAVLSLHVPFLRSERSPWHDQGVLCAQCIQQMHRGKVLNKLDWQGELRIEFRPGSMTGENVEHLRFITNRPGEEIMLKGQRIYGDEMFQVELQVVHGKSPRVGCR
jgi:hypothetical protein